MNLKAFHVLFVSVSVILALAFAGWAFGMYRAGGGLGHLVMSIGGLAAGGSLGAYGVWFLRKMKRWNGA